jgi:hypothetical protein
MTTDLKFLAYTARLTATLWIPYIVRSRGCGDLLGLVR